MRYGFKNISSQLVVIILVVAVLTIIPTLPIVYEGETYGSIGIHADTSEIYLKTKGFGVTLLPWALSIFALALFLAILLQKKISGPITHLADITQRIAASEDFSIRAPTGRNDEIGHLYKGFNNMLAFSRKQVTRKEKLNVKDEIELILKMIKRLLGEDIAIHVLHESEDLCIMADRSQMEQIILNLSINARDAMPKGGSLTIETRMVTLSPETMIRHFEIEAGPHACIIVTDTGEGMPPDALFQPFRPRIYSH